ncbi:MAG: carboxypeptidase regulatory-like domain-containing protein [Terracidiphilus sp.]|nr:carboxypeptidase regulatory-like domain-containing protein [Terracidiphilus sp.]
MVSRSEAHVFTKLHFLMHFLIALALGLGGVLAALAETPATPAPPLSTATLRGHIADATGAVIPGAPITITTPAGVTVRSVTADSTGGYVVNNLAPGSYIVQATYAGFAPFASPVIQLTAGQMKRVEISMAIEAEQQSVTVTEDEDTPQVSVDAGSNASAVVIKGKDLDALSDDPDELSNELSALAGPSAGPNGGQIYIDGFTGGTLPPKSAIREIRINQNPFSAEFDRIGYGRIQIFTKPGTDVLHGRGFLQGNDDNFNTGNPFAPPPAYHSIQYNGSISGSLNKKASFFFSVEGRNNPDARIYSVDFPVLDTTTGLYSLPTNPTTGSLYSPSNRIEVSPRVDLQLGEKNTLTVRYQFERSTQSDVLGSSTSLPAQATGSTTTEQAVQLSDSQIINDRIVNETRFQYRRAPTVSTSVSTAPTVSIPGYFTDGGNSDQFSTNHSAHLELQNVTMMTVGSQAIKFGTWMRDNREASSSDGGFNGSFSFPSLTAYIDTRNGLTNGLTVAQIAAACTPAQVALGGCTPTKLTYTTGGQKYLANVFDGALFFQDDWKVNQFLTLSGGLRWESQNHTADHSDFGPRVAFAYALDGHKNKRQAKTVLRGGFGFFYDRFQTGSLLGLEQNNGGANSQVQTVITNPTCFSNTSLSDALAQSGSNCSAGGSVNRQIQQLDPNYHSPYNEQLGVSLERQLTKASSLTLTYVRSNGVHQIATRNSNAYLPGTYAYGSSTLTGTRPDPSLGIVDEIYPEAVFKQNQLIVNFNGRFTPNFNLTGFYTLNFANGNTGTASNSYDLNQDYGRAGFVRKNMLFLMSSYTGKWGIAWNPFLIAQSGRPFDITTNTDLTGDNFFNNRPSYASSTSDCSAGSAQYVQTSFGCLDTNPQTGEILLPSNLGNSPASVAVNLRVSRSIGIGPKVAASAAGRSQQGGGPGGGGPPPMMGGGGPGGGGGGRGGGGFGGGGGGRGGMSNTGHKYSLTFSAQALNLFNDINYGTPSGSVVPTLVSGSGATAVYGPGSRFDKSTSLAGGIFASPAGSAARRIFLQAAFSF